MSREDVEAVRRGFDAFGRRDRQGIKAVLAPEVTWYPALAGLTERSAYHGPEAVCTLILDEIPSILQGFAADVLEVADLDSAVLATVRFRGRAVSTGVQVEQTFFQLHRIRGGKGVEMRAFTTREEALEAAGLTE